LLAVGFLSFASEAMRVPRPAAGTITVTFMWGEQYKRVQ
jgi:hypothetical protein